MKKIHMVGNGHIDPVWLWRWQEGLQEVKATFKSALDRMDEDPEFKFSATSTAFYEWVKENNPKMFERIQERVKEGRWEILGGWYIEPDCNLADGESYVRQGLYGQKFLKENFGEIAKVGCNPDTFGHSAMLPQILTKSGLESYFFMRPEKHEGLGHLKDRNFLWNSIDGSSLLAYRIPEPYAIRSEELESRTDEAHNELEDLQKNNTLLFYGVGNHGGGPTKQIMKEIHEMEDKFDGTKIIMSTAKEYLEEFKKENRELEKVEGELQYHANGCYSVNPNLKAINVRAEQTLMTAEKFSTITNVLFGTQRATKDFEKAWKNILFNQFHDVITGACIKTACNDAINSFGESITIGERKLNSSIQTISWDIDIPLDTTMIPIVIFNPHSWGGKKVIEFESGYIENESYMLDSDGNEIPMQLVQAEVTAIATTKRQKVAFIADVPPLGYSVFRIFRKSKEIPPLKQPCFAPPMDSEILLENDSLKVEFNTQTGNIKSIFVKETEEMIVTDEFGSHVVFEDDSDTWGHGKDRFKDFIGEAQLKEMQVVEDGNVRKVIRVKKEYNKSELTTDFILYKDLDYIDVKTKIKWNEPQKGMKIQFPVNLEAKEATYSIPYGITKRENNGLEVPSSGWVDYTENKNGVKTGLSIISNNKNSFDVEENVISLTILRNPIYAHLNVPETRNEYTLDTKLDYEYTGEGVHEFEYVIYPHKGDWNESKVVKLGLELKEKVKGITETYHKGSLKQKESYLDITSDNVVLSVLKQEENGNNIVARFREINGVASDTKVKFNFIDQEYELKFSPYEIKTIKLDLESKTIEEINMIEQ